MQTLETEIRMDKEFSRMHRTNFERICVHNPGPCILVYTHNTRLCTRPYTWYVYSSTWCLDPSLPKTTKTKFSAPNQLSELILLAIGNHKLYGLPGTCTNPGYRRYRQIKIGDGQKNNSIRNTIVLTIVGDSR